MSILTPLKLSTTLSILLHGVVVVVLLTTMQPKQPGGESLTIELVASVTPGSQSQAMQGSQPEKTSKKISAKTQDESLATENFTVENSVSEDVLHQTKQKADTVIAKAPVNKSKAEKVKVAVVNDATVKKAAEASIALSSNTLQQPESMLGLLHASISANKEYPYLARRQRREGMATVGFILHPDGTIEDTHLVHSSNASVLDRAALSAVKRIEPFVPAQHYLEQAETFKVNVVFSLL